eukprot:scaffold40383_cov60-Phaeocystis_antarctica.AAC.4
MAAGEGRHLQVHAEPCHSVGSLRRAARAERRSTSCPPPCPREREASLGRQTDRQTVETAEGQRAAAATANKAGKGGQGT